MSKSFHQYWNPYMTYTIKRSELEEWFATLGANAMYDGKLWEPKHKPLIGQTISVRFVEAQFTRGHER